MKRASYLVGLLTILVVAGCTQRLPDPPKLYQVRGKVTTADGKPIERGTVHFRPKDITKNGLVAWGNLKDDGEYVIQSFSTLEGAMAGDYVVYVEPYNLSRHGVYKGEITEFPKKYTDPKTSRLSITVAPQDNTYDIVLK